jgi:hypothetical protein
MIPGLIRCGMARMTDRRAIRTGSKNDRDWLK